MIFIYIVEGPKKYYIIGQTLKHIEFYLALIALPLLLKKVFNIQTHVLITPSQFYFKMFGLNPW